jgi:hypothetical protein
MSTQRISQEEFTALRATFAKARATRAARLASVPAAPSIIVPEPTVASHSETWFEKIRNLWERVIAALKRYGF